MKNFDFKQKIVLVGKKEKKKIFTRKRNFNTLIQLIKSVNYSYEKCCDCVFNNNWQFFFLQRVLVVKKPKIKNDHKMLQNDHHKSF